MATGPPAARAAMGAIRVAGGQIRTSERGSGCWAASASTSARSAVSPFIFQFPAASLTRIAILLAGADRHAFRHGKEGRARQLPVGYGLRRATGTLIYAVNQARPLYRGAVILIYSLGNQATTPTGKGSDPMSQTPEMMEGAPLIRPSSTDHPLYDTIVEACRSVYDPEIPVNIFDLGLVYTIDIADDNAVTVFMTLTAPGCPVAGEMPGWVADAIEPIEGVKQVDVALVWEPPWGMDMMSDEARLELGFM